MTGLWFQLVLIAVLVALNAALAGSEMALVSLREGQLRRLEADSAAGATLARLAREPNRFLATIQVGITLAGFLASASAAVSLAEPLEDVLGVLGGAARPASVVLVTLALSYVTLVLGELVPKRLAMQRAEQWGLVVARPLSALATAVRPVVWALSRSTDVVVRLFGGDPEREREEVTAQELRDLVAAQMTIPALQRQILEGAFEIAERSLRDVLRPRTDVVTVDADAPAADALAVLTSSGHSRAPVCREGRLDDVVGVVHLRDLLGVDPAAPTGDHGSPVPVLPETAGVLDSLRHLQARRTQMAVVVNEHGGAEGIVTVEDLVEELVGEIWDETDRDVVSVRHEAGGVLVVPGRFPVHDLPDVGVDLPEGDYATVAGFVLDRLQRVPERPGDVVDVDGWRVAVTAVRGRAITEVRITPRRRDPR